MQPSSSHRAAQYIRMSTDAQELSPTVQKQALQEYAAATGLTIVASYEDQGKTGLTIKDRPEMRRLLADIALRECVYDHVLVYDVSRWGRFQDTDASAYYEYHCRLNGVRVIYVKEPFADDSSPMATLVKNLKRMMAAEYSRELKVKTRAGQELAMRRGYQMGRMPCIGFRRVSVASDGTIGRELRPGERKPMLTDRVRWVHGPIEEVDLVRRIFGLYTQTNITMKGLVTLLAKERQLDAGGRPFTHQILRGLLRCEAFAGAFVWGRREDRTGLIRHDGDEGYTRVVDVVAPIIDRHVWALAQHKRRLGMCPRRTKEQTLIDLRLALIRNPLLALSDLPGSGCATEVVYRRYFGSFTAALRLAGQDEAAAKAVLKQKISRVQRVSGAFRRDLTGLIKAEHLPLTRRPRSRAFDHVSGARLAVQIIWRRQGRHGYVWWLNKDPSTSTHVLLVRMEENETAIDFLLLTQAQYVSHPPWFAQPSEGVIRLASAAELRNALQALQITSHVLPVKDGYRRLRYVTPLPTQSSSQTHS